jgi:tetratricopeptide (TPR) repeat protein
MTRRFTIAGAAAIAAALALLLGGALDESAPAGDERPPAAAAARLETGFAAGDTQSLVSRLERTVREQPDDVRSLTLLGLALQQRTRETADASYLSRSGAVLRRAVRLAPRDASSVSALGTLALAQHRFRDALGLGRRAQRLAPSTARHLGVVGDALVELGRYDEAFTTFDRMVALKPSLSSYARVSYARELLGRRDAAIEAMELALDAAGGQPEPTAWTNVELAKLHFGRGALVPAELHFRAALAAFPGYVFALDGLARVEAARGRHAGAIGLARRAVDAVPLPQFVGTLGDLLAVSGRRAEAREQYALVGAIERLQRANGVRTDLETALFDVDHGLRLSDALARARRAHADRPSIEADDVLAWALVRNGRCGEALRFSKRALRLGTRDAPKFFHRGMVERCLGRPGAARAWFGRALALNPHFSPLWAPVARRHAR